MNEKQKKIVTAVMVITAVYLGMKYLVPIFIPFLFAGLISVIILPAVDWLYFKLHLNRSLSAASLMIAACMLFLGLFWLLCRQLFTQTEDLICRYLCYEEEIEKNFIGLCNSVERLTGIDAVKIETQVMENFYCFMEAARTEKISELMGNSMTILKKTVSSFTMIIVTFISVLLFIKDFGKMKEKYRNNKCCQVIYDIVKKVLTATGTYLRAQLIIMSLISALCVIALYLLKNPYALLVGILIGLFDILPFIGTGTILVPWAIIELTIGHYKEAVVLLLLFAACSFVRELLEPKLIGKRLGVFPIAVLMAIYVGIRLFGLGGIVLGPISVLIIYEWMNALTKQTK